MWYPGHAGVQFMVNLSDAETGIFWDNRVNTNHGILMPWLLASPGYQQQSYWLCKINRSLSSIRKDFNYVYHHNVEKLVKMQICFMFAKISSAQELIYDNPGPYILYWLVTSILLMCLGCSSRCLYRLQVVANKTDSNATYNTMEPNSVCAYMVQVSWGLQWSIHNMDAPVLRTPGACIRTW